MTRQLSHVGGPVLLVLAFALLSFLAGPAEAQDKKTAAPARMQPQPAPAPLTSNPPARDEDAESFLPNPAFLQGQSIPLEAVAFSPDGKSVAAVGGWQNTPG